MMRRSVAVAVATIALPSLWCRTYYGETLSQEDWRLKNLTVADHVDDHCYESFAATRDQWDILNFTAAIASATAPWGSFANETTTIEQGRVAVCVTGHPRTLNMSTADPDFPSRGKKYQGTPVADSIHQKLFPSLERHGFDVFMYVSAGPPSERPRGNEDFVRYPEPGNPLACEPLRPLNTTNRLFCTVRLEPELPVCVPETFQDYVFERNHRQHVQLLVQLQDQMLCFRKVEEATRKNGVAYSHVLRLRPDTQVSEPFPPLETLDFGRPGSRKVYYMSKKHCCCGNEDSFAIGTYDVMRTYLTRYNSLQGLPTQIAMRKRRARNAQRWRSEFFVQDEIARVDNAKLMDHDAIKLCLVKPVSRQNTGDA